MKKFLAILLTLALCLSMSVVSLAEEAAPEVQTMEVELDESYVQTDLGENFCYTYLPADFSAIDETVDMGENVAVLGYFGNEAHTIAILASLTAGDTATSYEQLYSEATTQGYSTVMMNVNGFDFMGVTFSVEDPIVVMYNFIANEEGTAVISFTFTFAASEIETANTVIGQVLGGLNFYEQ